MPIARRTTPVVMLMLAVAAAGCSSGNTMSLFTGSTTPSSAAGTAPAPPPAKPSDRALQVAATSARASRCGYNFDPQRLRTSYMASESQAGLPAPEMATLEKLYDVTRDRVAKSITDSETYCTDEQTATIKRDLGRHMAGDFTPVRKIEGTAGDWWSTGQSRKPWNPSDAFKPNEIR
jgi:hypothetical protein